MELKSIIPGHFYMTQDDGVVLVKRINRDVPRGYWDYEKQEFVDCEPETGVDAIRLRDHSKIELNPDWILEEMRTMFWNKCIHEK